MMPIPWLLTLALCAPGEAELVSLSQAGGPASSDAFLRGGGGRVLSADGRWVVFESAAADLVPLDTNAVGDVYLRDRLLGTTRRISSAPGGAASSGHSGSAVLSADGGRVAFVSRGADLVPGADGAHYQVYVWDREDGSLRCTSRRPDGAVGGADSYFPVLSEDGSRLAFYSDAADLVPGDTNGRGDIFVLELQDGGLRRANRRPDGSESPLGALPFLDLSGDGESLAFVSADPGLSGAASLPAAQGHLLDLVTGELELVSLGTDGAPAGALCQGIALARDGRVIAFECTAALRPDDANGVSDVYLRDRALARTRCLSLDATDRPMGGFGARLSPGGRFAAFSSRLGQSFSPAQLFLRDRAQGSTHWLSEVAGAPADGDCLFADLLEGGSQVVFFSAAAGFVLLEGPGADILALVPELPEGRVLCLGDATDWSVCPCGNRSGAGEGCAHAGGIGARLFDARPLDREGGEGLLLGYEQGFAGGSALLLAGEGPNVAIPFQNGLFCAGALARGIAVLRPGPAGLARFAPEPPAPGEVLTFQVYYRDAAGPCGARGNLSSALRVTGE